MITPAPYPADAWVAYPQTVPPNPEHTWFVARTDSAGQVDYVHPIGFDSYEEAVRGAARLNRRDETIT